MFKKKKQRLTEKRNHTCCDMIQGRMWEREVTAWLDQKLDSTSLKIKLPNKTAAKIFICL